jgi:hypothetical protein
MFQRRFFLLSSAAVALGGCGIAPPLQAAPGRLVEVQLVDRARGEVLPEYRHRGSAWVAGRPGDRYAVRLINRSGARVMVVLSVDGINAITGQTATPLQSGYVLAPWQQAEITGWRKTDAEAAAFYFTALPDSYAARTDRPANVGVIGVAVFRERVPEPAPAPFPPSVSGGSLGRGASEAERAASADTATASRQERAADAASPAAKAQERNESRLGTGHGEREYAPVQRTAFERASSHPAEVVQVRYDSHANLVAAGVIRAQPGPSPFPGYVPDPPTAWNGVPR